MSVTVIIPTYNGANRIANLLRSLENQTHSDFDTVVVIDGSSDNTDSLIASLELKLRLRIISQKNKGRSGARNAGAAAAQSGLLIFLDDDMEATPDLVQRHLAHQHAHPGSFLTGKQQSNPDFARTDFQQYMSVRSAQWMNNYGNDLVPLSQSNLFFTSANCSLPKEMFDALDGFDTSLTDAEDFDLAARAIESGFSGFFDTQCLAWHHDFPDMRQYIMRQRDYREAWLKLSHEKPHYISQYKRFNPQSPTGLKKLFFKLFAFRGWYKLAQRGYLKWIPRKVRYRFYDYTIASLGRFNRQVKLN